MDVLGFFEANDTAYIVMEFLEGETLSSRLKRQLFAADEIFQLMDPVFDTLEKIHREGVEFLRGVDLGSLAGDIEGLSEDTDDLAGGKPVEILQDSMTILAEVCEWPDEIDKDRAQAARDRAEKLIAEHASSTDMSRAETALSRAMARINVLK